MDTHAQGVVSNITRGGLPLAFCLGRGTAMWGYRCVYRSFGPEVLPS